MSQKILVLDDEKLIRWTLEQHLAKEGFEALTADSAVQGLVIINDENDRITDAERPHSDFPVPHGSPTEHTPAL